MQVVTNYSPFEIFAVSVPNWIGSQVPLAAAKAGHHGVLDLEFAAVFDPAVVGALQRLAAAAPAWGVKLAASAIGDLISLSLPRAPGIIILTGADQDLALDALRSWAPAARVLVEALAEADLARAEALGADGLLAKGNEAGGRSADETSLILLQRLVAKTSLPIYVQGGVGIDTVAAFRLCGAAGVVLDWSLALFEAAQIPDDISRAVSRMDGSETFFIKGAGADGYRVFWRADHKPGAALKALADQDPAGLAAAVAAGVDPVAGTGPWLIGQDASFARTMLDRYGRLGPALDDLVARADGLVAKAKALKPLAKGAPLATSLGLDAPILQGPMTRVSDRAEFALAVAEGGGLPFIALALMRGQEAADLVAETKRLLGEKPWGVGILGFVDDALRREQMAIILDQKPNYALIAGGRPEQAAALEKAGIPTFLHVPSPGLLSVFLQEGARRFIFEGRECGGHVGPRTSAVLWQQAMDALRAHYGTKPMDCQIIFAGGIHDARSAAMVSALAADAAVQGAEVGVIIGSAYILTREAVEAGAVVKTYQDLVLGSDQTMLLESGVGHATRVVDSPIVAEFQTEKTALIASGMDAEDIREKLEHFNVGRSRVASKGIDRNPAFGTVQGVEKYISVSPDDQRAHGVYMIGQVAALHHQATTIRDLHDAVTDGAAAILDAAVPEAEPVEQFVSGPGARVALTGLGTILPKAPDLDQYWQNILDKVDAISEVPERRWDWRRVYDADKSAPDKTYSRWGGFVDEMEFDPIRYGIPPKSMTSIEPLQLLTLDVVRKALEDAGFPDGIIPDANLRRRTSVIIGVGGGAAPLGQQYAVRSAMPSVIGELPQDTKDRLPEWTEDSFPGILLNVIAGRVANRFDLGGVNFTVDAACGSSLAAVLTGIRELECGTSDMVVVAGVDAFMSPFDFIAFAKTQALSTRGKCRTFDASADGIAISEGLAAMVLRPLDDAEKAGDRIYAVVRGVAGASDGRDLSLTAPRPEGQQETLRRAYTRAGISPSSVELIEAHGTGTVVGDRTEIQSLKAVFGDARADKQFCGVGSVKSMIGHTKAAAGCAGMAKVALALHHRVLPPTNNVEDPSPTANFPDSPFYPVVEARPWIRTGDTPRRAGVSAFGFGGTNFHAVLEEYEGGYLPSHQEPFRKAWGHELLVFSAETPAALAEVLRKAANGLTQTGASLADTAASLARRFKPTDDARFAMVTPSLDDAAKRLAAAAARLAETHDLREIDPMGAFAATGAPVTTDQVAFLFSGQGSQYPGMGAGLAMHFPAFREIVEAASRQLADKLPAPLASYIYPRPTVSEEERAQQVKALMQTDIAQPAIGTISAGILGLLKGFGAEAGAVVGHSFGELSALSAAGAYATSDLVTLAHARGDAIIREGGGDLGTMTAVSASEDQIRAVLTDLTGITFANFNAPTQTVLAGSAEHLARAEAALSAADISVRRLPVACAFHSEFVAPARDRLAAAIQATEINPLRLPVYANETGQRYGAQVGETLARHLTSPVNFLFAIKQMHADGVRLFIEVGPNAVLARLTGRILGDAPHLAVATDVDGRAGVQQLLTALAAMSAAGMPLDLASLWARRAEATVDVVHWTAKPADPKRGLKWMIDPGRVRPIDGTVDRIGLAGRVENDLNLVPAGSIAAAAPAAPAAVTPPAPAPVAPAMVSADALDVMKRHHEMMAQMLASHAQTMQMFLGQSAPVVAAPAVMPVAPVLPAPLPATAPVAAPVVAAPMAPAPMPVVAPAPVAAVSAAAVEAKLLELIADRTGYPPEMLGRELNLEADLGIDSIKRVEILAQLRLAFLAEAGEAAHEKMGPVARERTVDGIVAKFMAVAESVGGSAPTAAPVAAPVTTGPARPDAQAVEAKLLELIADRTGYPPEMLGRELNLEADLGIDSIKRVEILAQLRLTFLAEAGEAAHEKMGPVARERSVDGIVAKFMAVADAVTVGAPVAPIATPSFAGPARPNAQAVEAKLLELIADRTGYPPEMLGRELNLESDLGIDSIKRVEILAQLRLAFLAEAGEAAHEKMGPVARERTVDGIVAKFMAVADAVSGGMSVAPLVAPAPVLQAKEVTFDGLTRRFVMVPVKAGVAPVSDWIVPGATYVITKDGFGVAEAVAAKILMAGADVVTLAPEGLTPETAAAALGAKVAQVAGVIHCAALLPEASGAETLEVQTAQTRTATAALYAVLHAVGGTLAERADGVVLAVSQMGGAFGFDGAARVAASAAGAAGLLKTVEKEWTQTHVRALDIAPGIDAETVAALILDEAGRQDGIVEIGWSGGARWKLLAEPRPIEMPEGPAVQDALTEETVILVTGGARGITARCLLWIAEKYRPRFVLAGSSPAPEAEESAETVGITEPAMLRAFLAKRAAASGQVPAIAEIERQSRSILKSREIRATLAMLEATGAKAEYHACDVRDVGSLTGLVDHIYATHGRIDGAIHGAGIVEDKLVIDKTPESFERVISTKSDSAFLLTHALRPEGLKFLVFFTSVAGRFGNRGQGDYGAANEIVSKLAQRLDQSWPGRVVAISWGPWDSDGMVNAEIKEQFTALGIEALDPALGIRALEAEIVTAMDSAPEVVWGYGPWAEDMADKKPVKAAE